MAQEYRPVKASAKVMLLFVLFITLAEMNFLAHIYLSGQDPELRIGNFIADSVKGKHFQQFPERVQQGIVLHRAIDQYTDTHPIFKKSTARLSPTYGHYSGVIVDILYDHFLAHNWKKYSNISLEKYVSEFYQSLQRNYEVLPTPVQQFLPLMIKQNWLVSYATIEGIGKILYQMNERTKRKSKMDRAVIELKANYQEFECEFSSFFYELQHFSRDKIRKL